MQMLRMIKKLLMLSSIFLLATITAHALTIDKIVVFGDSLSDNGNLFSLSSRAHNVIPLIPIIPKDPPYYTGRFSNGPVWVENLAQDLNVPLVDYAYGGAWVEGFPDSDLLTPLSLGMQVNYFLVSSMTDYNMGDHLFVIWAGSNDYLEGRADADYASTKTVNDIQRQIEWLVYYGAKNLLIMGVPDLGVVPEITEQGASASDAASKLSNMHNTKLETIVKQEQVDHPDTNIIYGDVNGYFQKIVAHPEDYHLKNVKEACFGGTYTYALRRGMINQQEAEAAKKAHLDVLRNTDLRAAYVTSRLAAMGEQSCANPDEYLYWDHVHPTRIVHKIISTVILSHLGEISNKG